MSASKKNQPWWLAEDSETSTASHYEALIPSREYLLKWFHTQVEQVSLQHIQDTFELDAAAMDGVQRRLRAMCRDGQLESHRDDRYSVLDDEDLIQGRVQAHPEGFGFLVPDDKNHDDLFLHNKQMRRVFHGDKVKASIRGYDQRGRLEGTIVEVLQRNTHSIVGHIEWDELGHYVCVPNHPRIRHEIIIAPEDHGNAHEGDLVEVEIVNQPSKSADPTGRVKDVMGDEFDPGMEIEIAVRNFDVPFRWPDAVNKQAAKIPSTVPTKAKKNRLDLRDTPLVTIDGADARDFDDAVYCERDGKGWRLLVAIADVAEYVKPGEALDDEAYNRGTSVYFPSRVISMLPEVLSNGLCSLNPKVDRLCMVCEMWIDEQGHVQKSEFHEAVMRSHQRFTYDIVAQIVVDRDDKLRQEFDSLVPHLDELYSLYHALRHRRESRGALDFDTRETSVLFNRELKVDRIVPVTRNDAHKLIEECMISANVEAAKFLDKHSVQGLFRNHPDPSPERINNLRTTVKATGLKMGGGEAPEPLDLQLFVSSLGERPDKMMLQMLVLRSMAQAQYEPARTGHYGLALEHYAHFTSPIRRYPDLLTHRAIKHILRGGNGENYYYSESQMGEFGEHCCMTERRADDASRDVLAWLKCEYMRDRVGEILPGTVSGVTGFGMFVELSDIFIEGLVHISELGRDYFNYDEKRVELVGERSGKTYRLGDQLTVKIAAVNLDERKIDFALVSEDGELAIEDGRPAKPGKRSGKRSSKAKGDSGEKAKGKKKSSAKSATKPAGKSAGKSTAKKARTAGKQGGKKKGRKPPR